MSRATTQAFLKYSCAMLLCAPMSLLAAQPVAGTAARESAASQLGQLLLGLLLVVGLIFALAWLARRVQNAGGGLSQAIRIVASLPLGTRDRLLLVQVGDEQLLLGISPGRISTLHVLKEPIVMPEGRGASPEFAQRLMELLGKDQKDKS
jgi:flagellar protein FliO/FliZ